MKKAKSILVIALMLVAFGCGKNQSTDDLITVDVTKSYSPDKDLILQDFMDVEYIPLETNDDFVNQGFVMAIGKEIILVRNRNDDGNIFVYDRNGKALRKINRKGQGGEEYTKIFEITLDEDSNEMFINDIYSKKIIVYDLYGNYKRSLKHKEGGGSLYYTDVFNYDKDNLICYDEFNKEIPFVIVSKQDGSITKEIKIPFNEKKLLQQQKKDGEITYTMSPGPHRTITPFKGNWLLTELSSDTVYSLLPDFSLRPSLVRTPPIQSMNPGVFLLLRFLSDRYIFMETIKNVFDFNSSDGFPSDYFMYDKQEKTFSGYTVYNGDFSTKEELYMNRLSPVNHEIESWQLVEAYKLVESYKDGELKEGRLKEIAATLDEDSNSIIMLIKHKK